MPRRRGDDGQALPFGIALAGLAAVLTVGLGTMVGDVVDAARARTAADAAALAGVSGGPAAAGRFAAANGAQVVAWSRSGGTVTVTVAVGSARATARATDDP